MIGLEIKGHVSRFVCPHGDKFAVELFQGEVRSIQAEKQHSCRETVAHVAELIREANPWNRTVDLDAALALATEGCKLVLSGSTETTAEKPAATRGAEGGERVSRPPQSAPTSAKAWRLLAPSTTLAGRQHEPSLTDAAPSHERMHATDDNAIESDELVSRALSRARATGTRFLACQVETIEAVGFANLSKKTLDALEAANEKSKEAKGDSQETQIELPELSGMWWDVEPTGSRRLQYRLRRPEGDMLVSKTKTKNICPLAFRTSAEMAWGEGRKTAWEWFEGLTRKLHTVNDPQANPEQFEFWKEDVKPWPRVQLSRFDMTADFLNLPILEAEAAEFVARPRRRTTFGTRNVADVDDEFRASDKKKGFRNFGTDDDWKPIEKDSLEVMSFLSGLQTTGFQIGKGDVVACIYDKTREIKEKSPWKSYLYGQWSHCDACGCKAADHEHRVETAGDVRAYGSCQTKGCDCVCFVFDESSFLHNRECAACKGSGDGVKRLIKCQACSNGVRKKIGCQACKGEGRVLSGRKTKCRECGGKGSKADQVERVEVRFRRPAIKELGKAVTRTCASCAGLKDRRFTRKCKTCKGAGEHACVVCHGSGSRRKGPCERCDGGRVKCGRCEGVGAFVTNKPCRTCRSRGVLHTKPKPEELADPQKRFVVATGERGALNLGEDLELDLDTWEGWNAALPAIWRYAVGGGQGIKPWLTWRVPSETNPQRTRWALRDEWRVVQHGPEWGPDTKDVLVRTKKKRAKAMALVPQLVGTFIAITAGLPDQDEKRSGDDEDPIARDFTRMFQVVAQYEERKEKAQGPKYQGWDERLSYKRGQQAVWGLLGDGKRERALAACG